MVDHLKWSQNWVSKFLVKKNYISNHFVFFYLKTRKKHYRDLNKPIYDYKLAEIGQKPKINPDWKSFSSPILLSHVWWRTKNT